MDTDGWLIISLFVLMLLITAFAAAAETVLTSISRLRAKAMMDEGASRGRTFDRFMSEPGTFLTAIIVLNTFAVVAAAALATVFAEREFGTPAATIGAIVVSFTLILLFQVVPKTLAAQDPERVAGWMAGPVRLISILLSPLTFIIRSIARLLAHASGGQETRETPLVTEEELRMLVNVGEEEGIIEEDEREMIRGIFDLEDTTVRELMVPRIDVTAVPVGTPLSDILEIIIEKGYSRIPVYEENIDNILGILYAKDLLKYMVPLVRERQLPDALVVAAPPLLRDLLRRPYFIPESKHVDDLLKELQHAKVHIAIVIDEYGGTAGLVTIEDLLEEIVGEIQDEYDHEIAPIERISEDVLSVDGRVSLDDVNQDLHVNLAAEEYDTIGGLVLDQIGTVPPVGTVIDVTDQDGNLMQIEIMDTDGRRIKRVRVKKLSPSEKQDHMQRIEEVEEQEPHAQIETDPQAEPKNR